MQTSNTNFSQTANELIIKLKKFYDLRTDADLCKKLDIQPSTLSSWKSRDSIDFKLIFTVCKDLDVNWWINEAESNEKPTKSGDSELSLKTAQAFMRVPLVSQYAYAGYLGGFGDTEFIDELPTIPFITDREYKGKYVAFEVRGDSMDNGTSESYLPGDIVLGREIGKAHWKNKLHINKWDFVIVHRTDGILLKKIKVHDTGKAKITVQSLNTMYEDYVISLNDVVQLFNVVKVERSK